MAAYYNEIDKFKAEWLRELIKANLIASGEVDERSIAEVAPDDLRGFTQCHFFAGIGVWSYALRLAGWTDNRLVWTGSCPCPSFSVAGKGEGFNDPRHLWPAWFGLIRECRPATIFGEQVSAAIGHGWLDLVQTDVEGEAYAVGKAVFGACSVGAPHIRQRLYFVAHTQNADWRSGERAAETRTRAHAIRRWRLASGSGTGEPADARRARFQDSESQELPGAQPQQEGRATGECGGPSGGGSDAERDGGRPDEPRRQAQGRIADGGIGATRGFWANCDWWYGRDGKWRPIEPGVLPLVDGAAERMVRMRDPGAPINPDATAEARTGRLRGYGDAIVAIQAEEFIRAAIEAGVGPMERSMPSERLEWR